MPDDTITMLEARYDHELQYKSLRGVITGWSQCAERLSNKAAEYFIVGHDDKAIMLRDLVYWARGEMKIASDTASAYWDTNLAQYDE